MLQLEAQKLQLKQFKQKYKKFKNKNPKKYQKTNFHRIPDQKIIDVNLKTNKIDPP